MAFIPNPTRQIVSSNQSALIDRPFTLVSMQHCQCLAPRTAESINVLYSITNVAFPPQYLNINPPAPRINLKPAKKSGDCDNNQTEKQSDSKEKTEQTKTFVFVMNVIL